MTRDWNQASLAELAAHIVAVHHSFCREQLARLAAELVSAGTENARQAPSLAGLKAGFQRLSRELTGHLVKEETVLFPLIERIEEARRNGTPPPAPSFGSVANPIRMMILEHGEAERTLEQMRAASNGFQAPDGAGPRVQELCRALQTFEACVRRHEEHEDRILFPRAAAMENETAGTR